ncbi:zinc ribbon domain-containing protein [Geomonas sp. Red69]|uniref:Zinc ribbon domain-containing protein n=1 Tax=Geomonas diazotrophica TaxID=2843197 RepID=A0ABX8JMI1_9BACT|nr:MULTISPECIES: zinc ribbon domain-containing protein [Geomonas]MBU5637287.1 zinc ribbon domain-containing protein [Geomonas diazotrophica]QWV99575.1 zinc ribbon domain-containing protein [Geomonas nitrogeniifigens]QXE88749.1 zinc ribbon domain-containing protein [Geomonas nitrogeniifigens]
MPIFEYVCNDCGTRFEKLQKGGAADECGCPTCGSAKVKKAMSTFAAGSASETKCHSGG